MKLIILDITSGEQLETIWNHLDLKKSTSCLSKAGFISCVKYNKFSIRIVNGVVEGWAYAAKYYTEPMAGHSGYEKTQADVLYKSIIEGKNTMLKIKQPFVITNIDSDEIGKAILAYIEKSFFVSGKESLLNGRRCNWSVVDNEVYYSPKLESYTKILSADAFCELHDIKIKEDIIIGDNKTFTRHEINEGNPSYHMIATLTRDQYQSLITKKKEVTIKIID